MKLFIACVLLAAVAADRLDKVYLPPSNAQTSGGNGNLLNTPLRQGGPSSGKYGTPTGSSNGIPSSQYGTPSGSPNPSNQFGAPLKSSNPSNQYGAPSGPSNASPSGQYSAPSVSSNASPNSQYDTTSGKYNSPSGNYGAPSGSGNNGYSNGPQSAEARAAILRFENEKNGDGTYRFEYETENKIYQQESGELKNVGTEQEGSVVEGTYSYVGPDGVTYTVNYIADENGFRATGDHIPTPPPVPEEIQKSLDLIAAQENQGYPSGSQDYNGQQGNQGAQQNYQPNGNNFPSNGQPQTPNKPSFNQQSGYQY